VDIEQVRITGFSIGVNAISAGICRISDSEISANGNGATAFLGGHLRVLGTTSIHSNFVGIYATNSSSVGVQDAIPAGTNPAATVTISDNVIGVNVQDGASLRALTPGVSIDNNEVGLSVDANGSAFVAGISVVNNDTGVRLGNLGSVRSTFATGVTNNSVGVECLGTFNAAIPGPVVQNNGTDRLGCEPGP
jgi:hypothetical protein